MNHAQQKAFFDTFGYVLLPGLLLDRISDITSAFDGIWKDAKRPLPTFRGYPSMVPFLDQSDYLCGLLDDPLLEGVIGNLINDDFNYLGSDGNLYSGETCWHSDVWEAESPAGQRCEFLKVIFYLDPLTAASGCLRVIPGSHRLGTPFADELQQKIGNSKEVWDLEGHEIPAIALETKPGDVIIFNHKTKHASYKGGPMRRMFTMNCCRRMEEALIPELKTYCARFDKTSMYGEKMLTSTSARRRIHLQQVLERGELPLICDHADA
jgi:hypothetical protein